MADPAHGTPVIDHRTPPRGVVPRRIQSWIMAGLAVGILGIILVTGRPEPPPRPPQPADTTAEPRADRLREYQDRLRLFDERARQEQTPDPPLPEAPRPVERPAPIVEDTWRDERRRREYESLFASNVVASRRRVMDPDAASRAGRREPLRGADSTLPAAPSLDDVAQAVLRATTAPGPPAVTPPAPSSSTPTMPSTHTTAGAATTGPADRRPRHRLREGTVIDTVLTNRLDGSRAAPVACLVTTALYAADGATIVIPPGSRLFGETTPVQAQGETRLAVTFHRLVWPQGESFSLDGLRGLNQRGDLGLRDHVQRQQWSAFAVAGAMGLISGLTQFVGTRGLGATDRSTTVVLAGAADATGHVAPQVLQSYLNRLPTITIREGHRVKVYLTRDIELPAYPLAQ
jgi:type IV secretion system protein VirB10